jgi:protein-disulfide isomerase
MVTMNRRNLLASSALAVAAAALAAPVFAEDPAAGPVDLAALMAPPALGEMALGAETAKVVIIEYASASCPHCTEFANTQYPILLKDYIETGKVRFIFREFPHNDPAMGAFMLARCAPKERYFPMVEVFFKTQEKWVTNPLVGLKEIALQAGFTEQTFTACLNNQDVAKKIFEVRAKAETFGVQGIPTFFINGKRYEGDYTVEAMKAVIDPLLG